MTNITDFEDTKRKKARNLRYKKPIAKHMNIDYIMDTLYEIEEECENVRWYVDDDEDSLINALDGNEDEAYEFRMEFADLCAECEKMLEDMQQFFGYGCEKEKDVFNTLFAASNRDDELLGWDSFEQDYLGIEYKDIAKEEAGKRLMKMTKEDLINRTKFSFNIAIGFLGLQNRYENLKSALDILRDKNTGHIQVVKKIEQLYSQIEHSMWGIENDREFDRYTSALPQEAWIA